MRKEKLKLKVTSKINPLSILGRILRTPIEGTHVQVILEVEPLDKTAERTFTTLYEVPYIGSESYKLFGVLFKIDLKKGKVTVSYDFPLHSKGTTEFRVYFKELKPEDTIYDDLNAQTLFKSRYNPPLGLPKGTRYYSRIFHVYSFMEIILILFAIISSIGAFFEILNFFLK